jgi:hypothetical protein
MTLFLDATLGVLAIAFLVALVRVVRGPSLADRAVAADVCFLTVVAVFVIISVERGPPQKRSAISGRGRRHTLSLQSRGDMPIDRGRHLVGRHPVELVLLEVDVLDELAELGQVQAPLLLAALEQGRDLGLSHRANVLPGAPGP